MSERVSGEHRILIKTCESCNEEHTAMARELLAARYALDEWRVLGESPEAVRAELEKLRGLNYESIYG